MKLYVFKSEGKLVPATSEDKEKVGKMPVGEPFQISYVRIRNPRLHRLYFKFLSVVYNNLPENFESKYPSFNTFRKSIEMYCGHYEVFITLKGEEMLMPKSISYETLDDIAFQELYTQVKNFIGTHIMPNIEDVEKEVERFY